VKSCGAGPNARPVCALAMGEKLAIVFTQTHSPLQDFLDSLDAQSLHGMSHGDVFAAAPLGVADVQAANAGTTGATTSATASTRLRIRSAMVIGWRIAIEAYYTLFVLGHR
jgi:hypothetical protein